MTPPTNAGVPAGATVDGASIPQSLWTLVGGPFEGKYRNASIIHDWYCDLRTRPWKTVHRVFYEAMRTSGVGQARAKLMYAAVYWGGPRWSETVVDNTNLVIEEYLESARDTGRYGRKKYHYVLPAGDEALRRGPYGNLISHELVTYRHEFSEADLKDLQQSIKKGGDLPDIERLVDDRIQSRPQTTISIERRKDRPVAL